MSFINWGNETPEQKAARRRFEEEQALFEQMMSASAAAAAAAAGAAGGGGGIPGPSYCGGDKIIKTYTFPGLDFLDDAAFRPADAELLNYDLTQPDLDTNYRAARDARLKRQNENVNSEAEGKISRIEPLPDYAPSTVYHRGIVREVECTWWLNTDDYEEWTISDGDTGLSAADVMPGVKQFTFLDEVQTKNDFPATGKLGEVIYSIDAGSFYAWDGDNFDADFYKKYVDPTYGAMRSSRDKSIKSKNEVILSMSPFIWASYYIIDYRVNKDNLF